MLVNPVDEAELLPKPPKPLTAFIRKWWPSPELWWLGIFSLSGIALGMCFEVLDLHAGPAKDSTFFLCFIGYWSQAIVGGFWILRTGTARQGQWPRRAIAALVASAVADGAAQALNFLAQMEGGYTLFTLLHSSVTFFACVIAAFLLRARPTILQWLGALAVVAGLLCTAFPSPVSARESYGWSTIWALVGSFCLAVSYPLSELVFAAAGSHPPSEEMACACGSLLNVGAWTIWTLAYTVPNWHTDVVEPMLHAKQPSVAWAVGGYIAYGLMVGLHSLSFWKSVFRLGTVPVAVSKGAQQAGIFVVAHLLFCKADPYECLVPPHADTPWKRAQRPVACAVCVLGCVLYVLGKRRHKPPAAPIARQE